MKKILILLTVGLLSLSACKKEKAEPLKAFEDITSDDIIKLYGDGFPFQEVKVYSSEKGQELKPGAILLYITRINDSAVLGKLKIISVSPTEEHKITFDYINYSYEGNFLSSKAGNSIDLSFSFDFESGALNSDPSIRDFRYHGYTDDYISLIPIYPTFFYVYSKGN